MLMIYRKYSRQYNSSFQNIWSQGINIFIYIWIYIYIYLYSVQWTEATWKQRTCVPGAVLFVPGILPGTVGVCWTNKGIFLFTSFNFGQIYLAHQSSCDDGCLVAFQRRHYLSTTHSRRGPGRQLDSWTWLPRPVFTKLTHFTWILKRKGFLNTCSNLWFSLENFEWGVTYKVVRRNLLVKILASIPRIVWPNGRHVSNFQDPTWASILDARSGCRHLTCTT